MNEVFTNRDIATILWLTALFIFAMTKKDVRASIKDVAVQFFNPKLFIPLLISTVPAILIVLIFNYYDLWNAIMTKTAVVWAIGTGFVSFINTGKHTDGKELFFGSARDALKFIVILEFLINFYVFPLYIELIFVPFVTMLVLLSTFAGAMQSKNEDVKLVKKFLDGGISAIGLALIIYVLIQFIRAPSQVLTVQNLEELILPILLTFTYIPSIYALAVYSSYEQLFIRLKFLVDENDIRLKLLCIRKAKLSLRHINKLSQYMFKEIAMEDRPNIYKIISNYE